MKAVRKHLEIKDFIPELRKQIVILSRTSVISYVLLIGYLNNWEPWPTMQTQEPPPSKDWPAET